MCIKNGEKYVAEQIESIINQDYKDIGSKLIQNFISSLEY